MSRTHLVLALALGLGSTTTAAAQQPTTPTTTPTQQLAAMDGRKPVPLLPMMANHQKQNMRDHLVTIQEIIAALATRDYAAVQKAATRIESSPQTAMMCSHMGAGAAGFTEQGMLFHQTADQIGAAAAKQDFEGTLQAVSQTLKTCTTCHATYQQDVVDQATWEAATQMKAPTHAPPKNP
jgi:hypothetical protein